MKESSSGEIKQSASDIRLIDLDAAAVGGGRSSNRDEDARHTTCSDLFKSILNIKKKYRCEAFFIILLLFAIWLALAVQLVVEALEQASNPIVEVRQESIAGNARFPYMTLCSINLVNPGLDKNWFKNLTILEIPNWDTSSTTVDSWQGVAPVDHQFISAEKYDRNGSCLNIDSGKITVKSNYHFVSMNFYFDIDYDVLCSIRNQTSGKCLKHSQSEFSQLFIVYIYDNIERKNKPQTLFLGFDNADVAVFFSAIKNIKLNGDESETWTFSSSRSTYKILDQGIHRYKVTYWFTFINPLMTVLQETRSGNDYTCDRQSLIVNSIVPHQ